MLNVRFGRLTAIRRAEPRGDKITRYVCLCDCGREKEVMLSNLLNKRNGTRSCGCARSPLGVFGLSRKFPREFQIFKHMLERCYDNRGQDYSRYGGRGIAVSDEWRASFITFLNDMGSRPSPRHTLDRIDVNGNYCKENCRWATMKEQNNNRRDNRLIEFNGQRLTASQWADITGFPKSVIYQRIHVLKWEPEQALTKKPRSLT